MDGFDDGEAIIDVGKKINIGTCTVIVTFLYQKICDNLKINLLQDPSIINIGNMKILLLHGDTLCTDDLDYQQFRLMVRSEKWQNEMLSKFPSERLMVAEALRKKSKKQIWKG